MWCHIQSMLKPGINTSICIHFIGGERASVNEVSLNTKFQKQYFSSPDNEFSWRYP